MPECLNEMKGKKSGVGVQANVCLNEMKGKKSGVGMRANVCADHVFPVLEECLNEMKGKKSGVGVRANVCADHVFPEPGEISGPHVSFRLAKFPIKASRISY